MSSTTTVLVVSPELEGRAWLSNEVSSAGLRLIGARATVGGAGGCDCVVLDGRRGARAASSVAELRASAGAAVVVVVDDDRDAAVDELLEAGASECVPAGVSPRRLARVVNRAVQVARAEAAQGDAALLAAARTLDEVTMAIVARAREAFGAAKGLLAVEAKSSSPLDIVAWSGYTAAQQESLRGALLSRRSPLTEAFRSGSSSLLGAEAMADLCPALAGSLPAGQTFAFLPMVADKRVIGVLVLSFDVPLELAEPKRGSLEAFARLCSQAVDRALLFDAAQAERRRAEAANRSKDEFLAVVSHELRTPLNAILGWVAMLRSGQLPGERHAKALETVERNARVQVQLIDDLLDVTRITTGKLRLSITTVDLESVVLAALDSARPAAEARGVRLQPVLDSDLGPTRGDPDRIQQIVWNLVSNAVKFTERGGRVWVALRRVGSVAEISVRDTGRGIDPAFVPHVFERFRQAETGATRGHGGLGLGLAIVRHLVELHGGTIEVASEGLGQGATFTVRLPFAAVAEVEPPSPGALTPRPAPSTSGALICPPGLSGLSVLVVDDEEDARSLIAEVLRTCGAQVASAATAEEGYERLRGGGIDVIVSDVGMPGHDGYAFIERVRALPAEAGGKTPAVALTAFARAEDRTKALLAGFDMHVAKPVEPAELLVVVGSMAKRVAGSGDRL